MNKKRSKALIRNSIIGLICNVLLVIFKAIVGFMCASQAMISDALNSAGDTVSSILSYIGSKISSKEADEDHNLGHGKAEYIFSLLISIVILIFCIGTFRSSILSFIHPEKYDFSIYLVIVCIVTIVTKLCLYIYTKSCGKKYKSIILEAQSLDHRNDCLLTSLNLTAAIVGLFGITYVDSIVGILISIVIFKQGITIFIDSYNVLMDKGMSESERNKIMVIINKHPEIVKIDHFNTSPIGYKYQVSVSIFVDGKLSTFESHEIANKLEKEIMKLDNVYLAIIHVNPVDINK